MANGIKTIDLTNLGTNSYFIKDGKSDYVFEGATELNNDFTLKLEDFPMLQYSRKVGDDLKFDCSYLVEEFDNKRANLSPSTIVYETENGYTTEKPTSGEYIIVDREDYDFYYDYKTGELTTDSSYMVFDDFTVTIKDYFKTDYVNNDKIILQYEDDFDSVNSSIMSIFEGITISGNGVVIGSDLNDDIYTDKINGDKIVSNDTIYTGKGDDWVNAGLGNDTIYLDKGNKTITFDINDGNNTIYLNGAESLILYFESALTNGMGYDKFNELFNEMYDEDSGDYDYSSCPKSNLGLLSYQKSGDDLIIVSPVSDGKNDTVTIKDYYSTENTTIIYIYCPEFGIRGEEDLYIGEKLDEILESRGGVDVIG
ncbi:MAG: hypothetical protein NC200_07440, partial [Candidatus Gastranaerophilales bacterium]|nr:hypothetical protein [Candidatus Gastranaerophilales bacterium]